MEEKQPMSPLLQTLENDIQVIGTYMREFSRHVISQEISEYPVYVAHQEGVALGKPFMTKDQHKLNWNYNVTVLEEFVTKKVVEREKVEDFMSTFGNPEERACVFVVLPTEASFVFVDYVLETPNS